MWDYTTPDQRESNRPSFTKLHPPTESPDVQLSLSSLKPGAYRLSVHRVGYHANDAYSQYLAWNRPKDLSGDQIAPLQTMTTDAPEQEHTVRVGRDGTFAQRIALRTNDAVLIRLRG